MRPRAKIKVSVEAFPHAADLMNDLTGRDRTLLGADPGDTHSETMAGHRFIATRLRCGGISIREPGYERED